MRKCRRLFFARPFPRVMEEAAEIFSEVLQWLDEACTPENGLYERTIEGMIDACFFGAVDR